MRTAAPPSRGPCRGTLRGTGGTFTPPGQHRGGHALSLYRASRQPHSPDRLQVPAAGCTLATFADCRCMDSCAAPRTIVVVQCSSAQHAHTGRGSITASGQSTIQHSHENHVAQKHTLKAQQILVTTGFVGQPRHWARASSSCVPPEEQPVLFSVGQLHDVSAFQTHGLVLGQRRCKVVAQGGLRHDSNSVRSR
jgi:hypothetical protein